MFFWRKITWSFHLWSQKLRTGEMFSPNHLWKFGSMANFEKLFFFTGTVVSGKVGASILIVQKFYDIPTWSTMSPAFQNPHVHQNSEKKRIREKFYAPPEKNWASPVLVITPSTILPTSFNLHFVPGKLTQKDMMKLTPGSGTSTDWRAPNWSSFAYA